ncbi:MAG TPA: hypothetical protein VGR54_00625 [Nitrosopumilaceae archaeon]|nr:hypothetical protein [Nitrosopumilaceae archaeon]
MILTSRTALVLSTVIVLSLANYMTANGSNITNFMLGSAFAQADITSGDNPYDPNTIPQDNTTDPYATAQDNSTASVGNQGDFNLNDNTTAYAGSQGDLSLNDNNASGVQGDLNLNDNNASVGNQGEIDNENNNEKALYQETQQDANNVDNAKKNDIIAAEVDINNNNIGTQSIDNNVSVKTEHPTSDAVSITVNASSQTGPRVLLINLNSTTIDVASMKYIDVRYDGNHITPAANVDAVLHPASSDQPHYAILVTQSGAQILISIPHFSTHNITISKIDKVMTSAVPEFPIALLVMLIAVTLTVVFYRIKPIKI